MTRRLVMLALAAPLVLAPSAGAVLPAGNIVQNGNAEAWPGATNESDAPAVPNWEVIPSFTAVVYGTGQFPGADISASIGGGNNFFAGGPPSGLGNDVSGASQQIDLSGAAAELDQPGVTATLTADIGGFAGQDDNAAVAAVFQTPSGEFRGGGALPAVTPEERGGVTGFVRRRACFPLEPGARDAFVTVVTQRVEGSYNDGYADNVSLTLSTTPCPAAEDAPLDPPTPRPQPRVSANAEVVRGRIFVKRPGGSEFQELRNARSIPVGSEVNAERGEVEMQAAADTAGTSQVAKFRDGRFVMTQSGAGGRRLNTDMTLTGGRIDKCPRTGTQTSAAARRPTRRLWGNGRGRFRTRGRYATATVRGTQWMVRDTCTTTQVRVARGSVNVRDLVKRRNVRLKAPKSYTARARRR